MVREVALPSDARAFSTLGRVDYVDAFRVDVGAATERTGEAWARATLEDAPASMRRSLRRGWYALGLRLGSTRSGVLGWEVRQRSPDVALLAGRSWVGMPAELLFKREQGSLLFATFVQHKNPLARAVWAGVAPGHRRVVQHLLERASAAAARGA
jgi:hypothetical protein